MTESLDSQFSTVFNQSPDFGIRAPGRINLIGEHIDYLDGLVMPMAIERSISARVAKNGTDEIRIWSSLSGEVLSVSTGDSRVREGREAWLNYPVGVLSVYRMNGIVAPGFDIVLESDLPPGAGLSSSAALETVFALAIEKLSGQALEAVERAKLCQQAEHEFAGVPCGIMDQLAVGASEARKALMIDCRNYELSPVSIPEGIAVVVSDTQVKHALGDGEYKKRRDDCEAALEKLSAESWREVSAADLEASREVLGERLFSRGRHAVSEIVRVEQFSNALAEGDRQKMGEILKAGHESLRGDFEVSCPELDLLVEAAYEFGAIGARMTGGGFGGSTITLVERESAEELIRHLVSCFEDAFQRKIEPFITSPTRGASYVEL